MCSNGRAESSRCDACCLQRAPAGPRLPLSELLRGAAPEGVDLVCKLLVLNPFKRLTAEQALEHPYVARFRRQGREPALQHSVVPALSDDVQLSVGEYRSKLYEMYERAAAPAPAPTRSPTPSGGSSTSSSGQGQGRSKKVQVGGPAARGGRMAVRGGGDGSVTTLRAAASKTKKLNAGVGVVSGAPKSKSGGSGSSASSLPLSTPPLRKPSVPTPPHSHSVAGVLSFSLCLLLSLDSLMFVSVQDSAPAGLGAGGEAAADAPPVD